MAVDIGAEQAVSHAEVKQQSNEQTNPADSGQNRAAGKSPIRRLMPHPLFRERGEAVQLQKTQHALAELASAGSDTSQTRPQSHASGRRQEETNPDTEQERHVPEILANPPFGHIDALFSLPIRGEWDNGMFLENLQAMLSQRLDTHATMEVNFIVNNGDPRYESQERLARFTREAQQTRAFIERVQRAQRLSQAAANQRAPEQQTLQAREQLGQLLQSTEDPQQRQILQLAADRASQVAVSAVDLTGLTMDDVNNLGYRDLSEPIFKLRTIGMDYAYQRLRDPNSVFFMWDVDSVPGGTHFVEQTLREYQQHPDMQYSFAHVAFRPPGTHPNLVATSLAESAVTRVHAYNIGSQKQTPQISFRRGTFDHMQAISGTRSQGNNEDYATAVRLTHEYGRLDTRFPTSEGAMPMVLTVDRPGFVDGGIWNRNLENMTVKEIAESFTRQHGINSSRQADEYYRQEFYGNDPSTLNEMEQERERAVSLYNREQQKLLRINRMTVRGFLSLFDDGTIQRGQPLTTEAKQRILEHPFGTKILQYVESNQEVINRLTEDDIALLQFYTRYRRSKKEPEPSFPEHITQLTPFQQVMREYVGDWRDDVTLDTAQQQFTNRDPRDRTSVFMPYTAQCLADAHVYRSYMEARGAGVGSPHYRSETLAESVDSYHHPYESDIRDRSQWIAEMMPQQNISLLNRGRNALRQMTSFLRRNAGNS